jgi:LPXTG-motif cell wall-anchored protein
MRALTRTFRCLLLAAVVITAFAAPSMAARHRGSVLTGCTFEVDPTPAPGIDVTITGSGFQEGFEVPISVNGTVVATVDIPNNGILPPTVIHIPDDAVYPITIDIPCSGGPGSGTATQTFAEPETPGEALASTGSNTSDYVAAGLGALVVGGVLLVGARRRSAVSTHSLDA